MKNIFNKIIETIKKHDNILVFFYFFSVLSVYIYAVPIGINDELWNFSFVYKMTNGYKIYKDLNVITTPMFHYLGEILMKLFGNNYICFRIYSILILSLLLVVIYILFKKCILKKINSFTCVLILTFFIFLKRYATLGASYNFLCLVFVILGIFLELNNNNNKLNNIYKGLVLFCIFMTKQNVLILYCMAIIILYFIKIKQKEIDSKELIKNIAIIGVSFILPLMIFLIYLVVNNSLKEFISYCFLGMNEFEKNNKLFGIHSIFYICLSLVGILVSIKLINIKNIRKEIKQINLVTIPFQVILLFWAYPIMDEYHMFCGSIISILILMYNLHNIVIIEFCNKKILRIVTKIIICIITVYFGSYNLYQIYECFYLRNINKCTINPYKQIIISGESQEKILNVCNYINENEKNNIQTVIISSDANLYMNVLNKNNKNLDLPLAGNLGKNGKNELIKDILELKKRTKILIKNEIICYQELEEVRNIILKNYNKIGEIEDFYIYER